MVESKLTLETFAVLVLDTYETIEHMSEKYAKKAINLNKFEEK